MLLFCSKFCPLEVFALYTVLQDHLEQNYSTAWHVLSGRATWKQAWLFPPYQVVRESSPLPGVGKGSRGRRKHARNVSNTFPPLIFAFRSCSSLASLYISIWWWSIAVGIVNDFEYVYWSMHCRTREITTGWSRDPLCPMKIWVWTRILLTI